MKSPVLLSALILTATAGGPLAGADEGENLWPNVIVAVSVESGSYVTIDLDHTDATLNITAVTGPRIDQGSTGLAAYDDTGRLLLYSLVYSTGLRGNGTFVQSHVGPINMQSDTYPGTNELYRDEELPALGSLILYNLPIGRLHFVFFNIGQHANVTFYVNGTNDRVLDTVRGHEIHFQTERDFKGPLSLAHENEIAGARVTGPVTTSIEVKNRLFGFYMDHAYYLGLWCVGYTGTGTFICPTVPPPVPIDTYAYEKPSGEKVTCRGHSGCGVIGSEDGEDERGPWTFEYKGLDYYKSGDKPTKKCQRPPFYPFIGEVCEIEWPGNGRPILFVLDPKFPGET